MDGFEKIGEKRWEATRDMEFFYGKNDSLKAEIDEGFVTDFATIPFPVCLIYPSDREDYALPSAVHDRLYATKDYSKLMADAIFYQAMKESGVNLFTRTLFFIGVALFGWFRWNKANTK
ncbi:MAG: DUF1353 domain-containing protein [Deltaproteobacteria bacterium]|nr:DUF1353 domain-containing protein [Deltaproteobacteria bacterium]